MYRIILNSIVSLILFVTTTGFTISEHYCSNKLVSVKINSEAKPCCDMNNGCCHTESSQYQLRENFIISTFLPDIENDKVIKLHLLNSVLSINSVQYAYNLPVFVSESPPSDNKHTVFSKFQIFII